jgi:PilZ domain
MSNNRRDTLRVPEGRLITQIVNENPHVASIVNVSSTGLFTIKPAQRTRFKSGKIQVEIPVPEACDSIWASAEVVFERAGQSCIGSGLRFIAMANHDKKLLKDVVEMRRQEILTYMMSEICRRKELAQFPSPFEQPLPAPTLTENTVRMYLLPQDWR